MVKLVRGLSFYIDPAKENLLCYGEGNSLSISQRPFTLWVTLGGAVDPESGFIVNVCLIDEIIQASLKQSPVKVQSSREILTWAKQLLEEKLDGLVVLECMLQLNDRLSILESQQETMLQVTKKYEVAAAHRLHNPNWDADKNWDIFGKCNNAEGHGHNYVVEVTVAPSEEKAAGLDMSDIDSVVNEHIVEPFDHKNLNVETPEFAELNPTVENMCKVFWDKLEGKFSNATLTKVGIWETPKTYAEYTGPLNG